MQRNRIIIMLFVSLNSAVGASLPIEVKPFAPITLESPQLVVTQGKRKHPVGEPRYMYCYATFAGITPVYRLSASNVEIINWAKGRYPDASLDRSDWAYQFLAKFWGEYLKEQAVELRYSYAPACVIFDTRAEADEELTGKAKRQLMERPLLSWGVPRGAEPLPFTVTPVD